MELEERHKQEKKELQAKIQLIKHSAPKGDKKRQKEAKAEIAKLETELKERHEREIQELSNNASISECEKSLADVDITENTVTDQNGPSKKSKAAKRREKKEREEKEREARIAQGLAESVNSARNIEQQKIDSKLKERNLILYDIPSDGDCLYKAIAHQVSLKTKQPAMDVKTLRAKTANEMRRDPGDYLPYLTSADGDFLDEEGYKQYLDKIENTHEWGGHVEIKAMCAALGYSALIIQADMSDINIEQPPNISDPLIIVYHRKLYELGEHYNSVIPYNNAD